MNMSSRHSHSVNASHNAAAMLQIEIQRKTSVVHGWTSCFAETHQHTCPQKHTCTSGSSIVLVKIKPSHVFNAALETVSPSPKPYTPSPNNGLRY